MRLEIPDSFDIAGVLVCLREEANRQEHHVVGEWKDGVCVLSFVPLAPRRPAPERLSRSEHPNVTPITSKRAVRGGNNPSRAA